MLLLSGSDSALGRGGSRGAGGGWVGPKGRGFRVGKECIHDFVKCLIERKALVTSFVVCCDVFGTHNLSECISVRLISWSVMIYS